MSRGRASRSGPLFSGWRQAPGFMHRFSFRFMDRRVVIALSRARIDAHPSSLASDRPPSRCAGFYRRRWAYSRFAGLSEMTTPRDASSSAAMRRRERATDGMCPGCGAELSIPCVPRPARPDARGSARASRAVTTA